MSYVRVSDCAARLGITRQQVWRLIKQGRLISKETVSGYIVDEASIEAYRLAPKPKGGRPRKLA